MAVDGEPDDPEALWRALVDARVVWSADAVATMLHYVRNAAPITAAEEAELAGRLRAGVDIEGAEQALREAHLVLVVTLAKHYTGRGTAFLELLEVGYVGLAQAIRAYNPGKGHRFAVCATWWIRRAITHALTA